MSLGCLLGPSLPSTSSPPNHPGLIAVSYPYCFFYSVEWKTSSRILMAIDVYFHLLSQSSFSLNIWHFPAFFLNVGGGVGGGVLFRGCWIAQFQEQHSDTGTPPFHRCEWRLLELCSGCCGSIGVSGWSVGEGYWEWGTEDWRGRERVKGSWQFNPGGKFYFFERRKDGEIVFLFLICLGE